MEIQKVPGCTRVVGESQGYQGLPLRDEIVFCHALQQIVPQMVTHWKPTPEELAALNAGCVIKVEIHGQVPPPMMLSVTPDGFAS